MGFLPHDGTEIPGFDGGFFKVELNIRRRSDVGTPHVSCSRQVRCAPTAFRYGCENLRKNSAPRNQHEQFSSRRSMQEQRDIRSKCPVADDCRDLLPIGYRRNSGSKHFKPGEKYQRKAARPDRESNRPRLPGRTSGPRHRGDRPGRSLPPLALFGHGTHGAHAARCPLLGAEHRRGRRARPRCASLQRFLLRAAWRY
jgi:hypothetical protein